MSAGHVMTEMYRGRGAVVLGCALVCVATVSPARAAEASPCANEALRAESSPNPETHRALSIQLPDCRAYELVSTPFKEGFPISAVAAVSADGSNMIASSFGAFAGTESDPFNLPLGGPTYEFTRTAAGWVASPLDPSAARFSVQRFVAVADDLSMTLWMVREPSESVYAMDLYLREADGYFVKVGSMVPPSVSGPPAGYGSEEPGKLFVVGASSDLSRVLFTAGAPSPGELGFLWPGDTTGSPAFPTAHSLYEYAGTGQSHPDLVGVSDGATVVEEENPQTKLVERELLPAGTLISDCGTWLGGVGAQGDKYDAVSADGAKVFFTAEHVQLNRREEVLCQGPPVDELYARVAGSATVAISSPTLTQCRVCTTATHEGQFQGASEDGSKVFFKAEALIAGDTGPNLYEYDFENPTGEQIVRVSGGTPGHKPSQPGVRGVARVSEDGTHVYFVATGVLSGENAEHSSPTEGEPNLYVFERDSRYPSGRTAFVATLSGEDAQDWGGENERGVQATPDGRFLTFMSRADLTRDDTSTVPQVFEYDSQREQLIRVSVGQKAPEGYECPVTEKVEEGYNCDGNSKEEADEAQLPEPPAALGGFAGISRTGLTGLSDDGSDVFFESSDALTPGALDNQLVNELERRRAYARNVYEYRSTVASGGGSIVDGNVYLISDGRDRTLSNGIASGVRLYGTDASGQDVFFSSGDPLVAQDTDTQVDVYDARVDGGFPAPVEPVGCEGEGCLGGPSVSPVFGLSGTASVPGGGNLTSPPVASPPVVIAKAKAKALTRAQKLARAMRACNKEPRSKRNACRARARARYGAKTTARKAGNERR